MKDLRVFIIEMEENRGWIHIDLCGQKVLVQTLKPYKTSIIVTYNAKDFKGIESFGVRSITPKALMEEIL